MYAKLILRNAKRSIKDYLIYIVTMTICVMLFYAFLSISSNHYRPDIGVEFNLDILSDGMKLAICSVTLLLFFLIRYVNHYMFQRRQKEFAMEAVMGMDKKTIGWLFFAETFVMGIFSVLLGICLGMIASQFISAMLLTTYGQPYRFSWMLYPDTVLLTIGFFMASLLFVGLFNMRAIQKIKMIDMLYADRYNEPELRKSRYIYVLTALYWIALISMTATGISKMYYYHDMRFPLPVHLMYWGNILAPAACLLTGIVYLVRRKKWMFQKYLTFNLIFVLITTAFAASVPTIQKMYSLAGGAGTLNSYMMFLLIDMIYMISCVVYLSSFFIAQRKERMPTYKYQGTNLFFLGQIISKLNSTVKSMTLICLTLVLSAILFVTAPALTGWASGYLDVRSLYDIQISSSYNNVYDKENLPRGDYELVTEFMEEHQITPSYDLIFDMYLSRQEDFHNRYKLDFPVVAISLSDYNAIREMLGYEQIELNENEFTTQWQTIAADEERTEFLSSHPTVSTDAGDFTLAEQAYYTEAIGEMVYNNYTDVIYVLPDAACEKLLPVMRNRFIMTDAPIPYDTVSELNTAFLKQYPEEPDPDTGVRYTLRMSTLQISQTTATMFILHTSMTYGAIVLMVICLTILSLQQLSEGVQHKYRFHVLHKLGVESKEQNSLILRQLRIWFGLPIFTAICTTVIICTGFFQTVSDEITAYIGWEKLFLQVGVMVCILLLLLFCYFVSTWILYKKSIDK